MEVKQLVENYKKTFNTEKSPKVFFSPGRVNLIGEHIDYNGGFVFPVAITFGTYGVVTPRKDEKVYLYSENFKNIGMLNFNVSDLSHTEGENWSVFVKGVIQQFKKAGYEIKNGFNLYVEGNIPNGSGLSSSASLEMLISEILQDLNGLNVDRIEKVKLSQQAENEYVGVQCGIMDQFAIGMGKKDYAIKLNTNDLSYEYALADLKDCSILIMNTNKKRELADSKYNERRSECEVALELLKTKKDMSYLCDLTLAEFEDIGSVLENEVLYKRAKHAITENERVKQAIEILAKGNLKEFGELLNQSHESLRDDYEVTGLELDTMVELARNQDGVLGARMTGAGFGGCAIALVKKAKFENAKKEIAQKYKDKIGYEGDFYRATIGDGTRKL